MGSTSKEARDNEQPPIRVRIRRSFWLGKYEVTQSEWQGVMGTNPSKFSGCGPDCPVERVSWNDAQDFIRRLKVHRLKAMGSGDTNTLSRLKPTFAAAQTAAFRRRSFGGSGPFGTS